VFGEGEITPLSIPENLQEQHYLSFIFVLFKLKMAALVVPFIFSLLP